MVKVVKLSPHSTTNSMPHPLLPRLVPLDHYIIINMFIALRYSGMDGLSKVNNARSQIQYYIKMMKLFWT